MDRYLCIHGHFYQPPRENPSLEGIELQDSAYPYHDWNERITAECYGPNGASRILDGEGRISRIGNNYAKMSFNFGPTLLSWMAVKAPEVYRSILAADRESRKTFSGHGSAIAQAYNHMIMPLANEADKRTQVIWGIKDFEYRFERPPEGMWLPETAVDIATLEQLAFFGIGFTILAPYQARRVRRKGRRSWRDVTGGKIDPTRAYVCRLPSGRQISLFFYDGPISRDVAFQNLLKRGENLAGRLAGAFSGSRSWPQLVHIATDGETYGHHQRHGDMALAYAIHFIESTRLARLTNYGEYLEKHPPTHEVEIYENTAWSCAHGIERWRSDCGCNSGGRPGWNQSWRAPLREALDWLRDNLAAAFERFGSRLFRKPWAARDGYVSVVLDRSPENVERFLKAHMSRELDDSEQVRGLKLLEIQRNAMLMYTSCGWFFDELSGIETVQVLQYAGRAMKLAKEVGGDSLEKGFLERLERAKSNLPEHCDGSGIYMKWVKPAAVGIDQVGAHYAMSSLFENYGGETRIYSYHVEREDFRTLVAGKVRLAFGRVKIVSEITRESKKISFGVLHLGDHNLSGGVREFRGEQAYADLVTSVAEVFSRGDLTELIRVMDRNFGSNSYSLKLLFRDEQRRILRMIMEATLSDTESVYRQVYGHHAPMMRFLADLGHPLPRAWRTAAELVVNADLRTAFECEDPDAGNIRVLIEEAKRWQVELDAAGLGYVLVNTLERAMERFHRNPDDLGLLQKLEVMMDTVHSLPFEINLWKVQNIYYEMLQRAPDTIFSGPLQPRRSYRLWLDHFADLGEKLGIRVVEMKELVMRRGEAVITAAREVIDGRRTPNASYRLQFNGGFTFNDAKRLLPYLYDLGISDVYASPLLKARAGSLHGYDICDHRRLNPAIGSEREFNALTDALRARGMGLILDTVPNHMCISDPGNAWWTDVLENGPSSVYASYFDIDWHPVTQELHDKVLLSNLGDQYGKTLENGKLKLAYENGAFFIHYCGTKLPVSPCTYGDILSHRIDALLQAQGADDEHVRELQSVLTALSYLPSRTDLSPEKIAERNREKEIIKGRIAALYTSSAHLRASIDTAVQDFNGIVGDARSFDMLDRLLDAQAYRTAFWRVAAEEINYRRFFDINELAAIRVELPEVFRDTHELILRLLEEGRITGLRIDHPDGLWNPTEYFRWLQEHYLIRRVCARMGAGEGGERGQIQEAVSAWFAGRFDVKEASTVAWPLYVVAEKILSEGELLPEDWPVDGTTGYDFLNALNGIFVDSGNAKAFDRIYGRFIESAASFGNLINSTRKMIMLVSLASEINALSSHLERISKKNRLYRDFTLNSLTFAIREIIAALPVYRTYITGPGSVSSHDQRYIETAVGEAKKRNPRTAAEIFDYIGDILLLRNLNDFSEEARGEILHLVMKFQQVTGPVMAKGVEDTAFYVYNRLISLNDVGGYPERFGTSVASFHERNNERRLKWPHSLLATATHDTKRGEDVRARINVLSEIPEEWRDALSRWTRMNEPKKTGTKEGRAPDRNDEYLLYQTLLGSWPDEEEEVGGYCERIVAYMQKAIKEAKIHTSWINPNEAYDAAVRNFVRRLLADDQEDPFIGDFMAFQRRIAFFGRLNALSQALLKFTAPGVPDLYQGNEIWDYSLVDPDNRRPVNFKKRREMLAELMDRVNRDEAGLAGLAKELLDSGPDGRIKLYVTFRALNFRRAHERLFSLGRYLPLSARGEKRGHVCAFARELENDAAIVVVPRLNVGLTAGEERPPIGEVWQNTLLTLPRAYLGKRLRNLFTGEVLTVSEKSAGIGLALADVCAAFPVALLERPAE
jgi:(1->4)-alpha-D-glucan 1-alpha-D-glucosylmutase